MAAATGIGPKNPDEEPPGVNVEADRRDVTSGVEILLRWLVFLLEEPAWRADSDSLLLPLAVGFAREEAAAISLVDAVVRHRLTGNDLFRVCPAALFEVIDTACGSRCSEPPLTTTRFRAAAVVVDILSRTCLSFLCNV